MISRSILSSSAIPSKHIILLIVCLSSLSSIVRTQQTFGVNDNTRYNTNQNDPFNRYNPNINQQTSSTANPSNVNNRNDFQTGTSDSRFGSSTTNRPIGGPIGGFGGNSPTRDFYGNTIDNNNKNNNDFLSGPLRPRDRDRSNVQTSFNNPFNIGRDGQLIQEATYFIVASRMVRPGQVYRMAVSIIESIHPLIVRASISRDGVEIGADSKDVQEGIPEELLLRVPTTSVPGDYNLRVEGLYNSVMGGVAFINETKLTFSQRSMTIFVQLDKPVYMQGEYVRFRTIPITTELKGYDNAVDVYMVDPRRNVVRRWLSRQSNLGAVSLEYKLADQPIFGEWTVRVVAQGQREEATFLVEEYYQTRFEVNVTMPAFFFNTDPYIYGRVMANFTNGAPVNGNLTLKATIRPIGLFNHKAINQKNRVWHYGPRNEHDPLNTQQNYLNRPDDPTLSDLDPRERYQGSLGYSDQYSIEKTFQFDEEWPFWVKKPEYDSFWGTSFNSGYGNFLPYLRYFNGTFEFKYPMYEIQSLVNSLTDMEVLITAQVGERFYDEIVEGYAMARIYNSSIRTQFLGGTPQVFKPAMPFTVYIVVDHYDGSPLAPELLYNGIMEVSGQVQGNSGSRDIPNQKLRMSERPGIWEFKIDLRNDLNFGERSVDASNFLNEVKTMRIQANFLDYRGERANAELLMLAHDSPKNKHIKVATSTVGAKVGEYIIFHIQGNFYLETYHYMIMSKGIVLLTGQETMQKGVHTMAVTLSAEMAPVATIVVWHIGHQGLIVADSLTFPVNGISRNNFTVYINNKKARTGQRVEVAIYGEAGAYVGLSGIDNAFYTMQAGNDITYAKVISKMSSFDEQTNGTFKHIWRSHEGNPDELVYFPSSTFGIDANRTFEYAGLVIFTDAIVPRRYDNCNITLGFAECLNGRCYDIKKRCDGYIDCEDGTDELACETHNTTTVTEFRKYRFNRIQRHYENVWLWKDINIGPHGRFIFSVDVPQVPAHWMITAFSISPTLGFGMIPRAIEYVGVQPFFINVEMPNMCGQGEQVGVRVTVFNYMTTAIEATVVLHGSPDYKFIHVGNDGLVNSYNPKTSFGEHQFFIYMEPQSSSIVYVPIVPTRLGDIHVTVHANTLLGKHEITRKLYVFADGLPQYRHQSILLDLSNRAYIFQYMHVNVTETPIIPYEIERYYVFGSNQAELSVVGDVVGPIFPSMPMNATSMLHLPMDSAEQNMFSFAANLFTITYMRAINQRNKTLESQAFYYMNIGYQRQLSYMMPDGSFSLFRADFNQSDSSVWLTAYCARIFQEASFYEYENYIYIDPMILSKSVHWLLRHQTYDGSFQETTWSPDRKMNSTSYEALKVKNITLTAHVLITLTAMKDLPGGLGSRVVNAQQRAVQWIERSLPILKEHSDPYDAAIVAYALMQANSATAEYAFGILNRHARTLGEYMYWGNEDVPLPPTKLENQKYFSLPRLPYKYDSLNIETTAYALLTYVSRRELLVDPIVRWLNAQRLTDAGWASTQDTSVALKALIEYTLRSRIRDVSKLAVTVEATSLPGETNELSISDSNLAVRQSIQIPNAWGTVKVQGKGAGYAILQMHVQYNVDAEKYQTKPPVPSFDLITRTRFHGRNQSHITYECCQSWKNLEESERSGMAILDVTIPTGYIIQQQRLDAYILSKRVQRLQRATFKERNVLFYFDYLETEPTCINFTIERWFPVANMTRYLPIRVYDFYAPERFNETIFDAIPTYLLNICEVCGSSQCPYCYIYNTATKSPVSLMLIIATTFIILIRHFRVTTGDWIPPSWDDTI